MSSAHRADRRARHPAARKLIEGAPSSFQALKSDQALKQRVVEMGAELTLTGPAEFGTLIDQDRARYGKIVAEGNLATQN